MHIIYSKDPNFDPALLTRNSETEQAYAAYRARIESHGLTHEEVILAHEFKSTKQVLSITWNNFRYNLAKGQVHFLLWDKEAKLSDEFIKEYIFASFEADSVIGIWVNSPETQTVKKLKHFHFIIQE
ncbi:MAG: hypothetical protein OHK0017_08010 [Patescibacteria group bacterium]